jgi:hypothetical protein
MCQVLGGSFRKVCNAGYSSAGWTFAKAHPSPVATPAARADPVNGELRQAVFSPKATSLSWVRAVLLGRGADRHEQRGAALAVSAERN